MINKKILYLMLFLMSIALCTGAFFEVYMEGPGKEELMQMLTTELTEKSSLPFYKVLFNSFIPILKIWGCLFLCPILPFLAILCPFICIYKGLSIGFSSTMLIEIFGIKGSLYILATIMPQNIIQLPLICILSTVAIQYSVFFAKLYFKSDMRIRNKNVLQNTARHYLTIFLIALIIAFISCLVEVCLKRFLL